MKQENNKIDIVKTIKRILNALDNNFKSQETKSKRISYDNILILFKDLNDLMEQYSLLETYKAADMCISRVIPMLNFICKIDNNKKHLFE